MSEPTPDGQAHQSESYDFSGISHEPPKRPPSWLSDFMRGHRLWRMPRSRSEFLRLGPFMATESILVYLWFRPVNAGCASAHKHDPSYYCPGGAPVLAIWIGLVVTAVMAQIVLVTEARERSRQLRPLIAMQYVLLVAAVVALFLPAFAPHALPPGREDSASTP